MSSTCFEPEGSYSGRRLYIQVWYCVFYMRRYGIVCFICISMSNFLGRRMCTFIYNRLPDDEPLVSKQVEDVKN